MGKSQRSAQLKGFPRGADDWGRGAECPTQEPMWCPDCQLTPAAADLMRRALDDMKRSRSEDPSWRPLICVRCGEVTGIIDDREGWVFGRESRPAEVVAGA